MGSSYFDVTSKFPLETIKSPLKVMQHDTVSERNNNQEF